MVGRFSFTNEHAVHSRLGERLRLNNGKSGVIGTGLRKTKVLISCNGMTIGTLLLSRGPVTDMIAVARLLSLGGLAVCGAFFRLLRARGPGNPSSPLVAASPSDSEALRRTQNSSQRVGLHAFRACAAPTQDCLRECAKGEFGKSWRFSERAIKPAGDSPAVGLHRRAEARSKQPLQAIAETYLHPHIVGKSWHFFNFD